MSKWENTRDKDYRSTYNVRKTLIILTLIIGILLSLIGIFQPADKWWSIVLITFGITFTSSALVSIIMLSAGLMDLSENAKELASVIGSRLGMPCAERFSLVESSAEVGLARMYISREQALQKGNFHAVIEDETDGLFIVGSSLLGFLQDRHFKHVLDTLKMKIHDGIEIKFMLTHPLFADFRAAQEGRDPGEIAREITKSLRLILKLMGSDKHDSDKRLVSVYLYRGTPTCFGILAKKSLLLNPYPYGRQAYESPCFEFDMRTPAYNLYRQAHFQTQFAGKIEKFELTERAIMKLESDISAFSQKVTEFESSFSVLNKPTNGKPHNNPADKSEKSLAEHV